MLFRSEEEDRTAAATDAAGYYPATAAADATGFDIADATSNAAGLSIRCVTYGDASAAAGAGFDEAAVLHSGSGVPARAE